MILFSAEAILASSNAKSGPGVPLIEREDLRFNYLHFFDP